MFSKNIKFKIRYRFKKTYIKFSKNAAFKKLLTISSIFILIITLCGCWDYKDINEKTVILSVGVDYIDEDTATYFNEIAKFSPASGTVSEKSHVLNIYNSNAFGRNFEQARLSSDTTVSHPIFLGATRVVVFGPKIAEKGIEPYLNRIDEILDYRKTLLAVVSEIPPNELLQIRTDKDNSVGFLIENNINWLTNSGKALYTTVGEMLSDIAMGDIGYVMPYIGIADNPILTEVIPGLKKSKNLLSFITNVKKRKITTDYKDNKQVININLSVAAQLRYQYYIESLSEDEVKKLEDGISKKNKKDISKIIEESQKDFQSDIFKFAKYFRADFPQIYKNMNWEEVYPTIKVNLNVETKIVNFSLNDPNASIEK